MTTKPSIYQQQGYIIYAMAFTGFLYGFVMQSFAPILPYLADMFTLNDQLAGTIIGAFALSAVFVCIPAGLLGDKVRVKPLLLFSTLLTLVGCLLTLFFDGYSALLIGRLLAGSGCAILLTLAPKFLIQTINQQQLNFAVSVYSQAITVGFVLGVFIGQWSFDWWGFIGFQWTLIIASLAMLGLLLPIANPPASTEYQRIRAPNLAAILLSFVFFFHGAGVTQMMTFSPIDLSALGYSKSAIAWITAGFFIPSMLFTVWFCALCKTVVIQKTVLLVCQILMILTTLTLLLTPAFTAVSIIQGVCFIGVLPIAYLLTNALVLQSQFGFVYGIYTTCYTAGVFIGGQVIGSLRDQFNSELGYLGIAIFAFLSVIAIRKIPTTAISQ